MNRTLMIIPALLCHALLAQETSTIRAYVDSDICSRLMLGAITPARTQCSQNNVKEGDEAVLVRLRNNMVFSVNKPKLIQRLAGQYTEASGTIKVRDGTMKLTGAQPIEASAIPPNDPDRKLIDAGHKPPDPKTWEKIRHELAMMPYITDFDFISFTLSGGGDVILTGWTVRQTNRNDAFNAVKNVPGVETVVNNIDILPLGSFDMQIRAGTRAALQRQLSRYFWANGSDIKIIVKNGQVILLGRVSNKSDSDVAFIQANGVQGAFKVFNMLRVQPSTKESNKGA